MTQDNKESATSLDEMPFDLWIPEALLVFLRKSEDGLRGLATELPAAPENPEAIDNVPVQQYVELLAAVCRYFRHGISYPSQPKSLPNTHVGWIAMLDDLIDEKQKKTTQNHKAGNAVAISEKPWQKHIVRLAWDELRTSEKPVGWTKFRKRCQELAKKQGHSNVEVKSFTEHYTKKKLRTLKQLDKLHHHKSSQQPSSKK
jgi:hypothetical protein